MGSHHASYTSSSLAAYVPPTSLSPTRPLFSAVRSFDADLTQVSTYDRDLSPSTYRYCGQYDREILHARHDCPTYDEPATGHPWHDGYTTPVEKQRPTSQRELWNDQTVFMDDTIDEHSVSQGLDLRL